MRWRWRAPAACWFPPPRTRRPGRRPLRSVTLPLPPVALVQRQRAAAQSAAAAAAAATSPLPPMSTVPPLPPSLDLHRIQCPASATAGRRRRSLPPLPPAPNTSARRSARSLGLDVLQFVREQAARRRRRRRCGPATAGCRPGSSACGVITSTALAPSSGMKRNMPATGVLLCSPNTFSRSATTLRGAAGLQREHADRHARQPVDVEDLDRAQVVLQLARGCRRG